MVVARTRRVRAPGLRTWLRIIHWRILVAFTIPEVITLVLHPIFRRAAVDGGFRKFPQFDSVAERVGEAAAWPGRRAPSLGGAPLLKGRPCRRRATVASASATGALFPNPLAVAFYAA